MEEYNFITDTIDDILKGLSFSYNNDLYTIISTSSKKAILEITPFTLSEIDILAEDTQGDDYIIIPLHTILLENKINPHKTWCYHSLKQILNEYESKLLGIEPNFP